MPSTFLASTSSLLRPGIFNLAITTDKQGERSLLVNVFGNHHPGLWTSKLVPPGVDFSFAFFNFTLAVRYFNHTGFLLNLPAGINTAISVQDVAGILERGGTHHMPGMRGYYRSIPPTGWLVGALWMLGTVVLIIALHRFDRGV